MHLIFDQMWDYATILLWPLLGPLLGAEIADLFSYSFFAMFNIPELNIPEIIGLVMLVLCYRLVKNGRITGFITDGAIGKLYMAKSLVIRVLSYVRLLA